MASTGNSGSAEVTQLLLAWRDGDAAALERLVPLVHAELRRIARGFMRKEQAGHTLQTSALVNEAYMRLIDARQVAWQNRAHFFAISASLMRRILVDFARERRARKRGGSAQQVVLDDAMLVGRARGEDVLAVDEALHALAKLDERKSKVVELRFFGGLNEAEIAEALQVSPETVRRDWRLSKAWLLKFLSGGNEGA
ncbi:MAG: sigma-70 family RNA polymerase sigma factor [Acidobacteria bacterium]|nr:sigma-70 family RNA polymerase sigma factor [Acidobacteriota bacterium]MBI3426517.1 sigma-70 family RNA polymerase sigma factor [Acidobacteriota bacterium]